MRTIKFRGFNEKNKKWIYGYYLVNRGEHFICEDGIQPPGITWEDFLICPDTIGQFTGLYDSLDVEIYEGDILHLDNGGEYILCVGFNEEVGAWGVAFKETPFVGVKPLGEWLCEYGDIEVIGNIHDNQELIKR